MRIDKNIKVLGIKTDLTMAEIGRRLHKSPQAFNQKIKRGTFTIKDLQEIANVTNCTLECDFVLPTGERIRIGEDT